ncbi:MAG: hypothetical protein LPK80_11855 [Bacteroidota bacterium]|nr:hypothetical protein [Bacteroidota bacterium]MDX5428392.1 hypothetical protein [Bacteroidota bacterium]MDX5446829.1 hypothetical protein [Bacteroidota bacterium]MDX5506165.1 hypothetical protein [Bacteroidota bacterium]
MRVTIRTADLFWIFITCILIGIGGSDCFFIGQKVSPTDTFQIDHQKDQVTPKTPPGVLLRVETGSSKEEEDSQNPNFGIGEILSSNLHRGFSFSLITYIPSIEIPDRIRKILFPFHSFF